MISQWHLSRKILYFNLGVEDGKYGCLGMNNKCKEIRQTHHGTQASTVKAIPQSDTTIMVIVVVMRNFDPSSNMRVYWNKRASFIAAADAGYIAFPT